MLDAKLKKTKHKNNTNIRDLRDFDNKGPQRSWCDIDKNIVYYFHSRRRHASVVWYFPVASDLEKVSCHILHVWKSNLKMAPVSEIFSLILEIVQGAESVSWEEIAEDKKDSRKRNSSVDWMQVGSLVFHSPQLLTICSIKSNCMRWVAIEWWDTTEGELEES